jgi:hypothetical protein
MQEAARNPVHFDKHSWCAISSRHNEDDTRKAIDSLGAASKKLGVRVEQPEYLLYDCNRVEMLLDFLAEKRLENYKILLFVLDNRSENWYPDIKRMMIERRGIPSQMCLKHNLKKNLSYFSGVLNQMLVKVGGVPFNIELALQKQVRTLYLL